MGDSTTTKKVEIRESAFRISEENTSKWTVCIWCGGYMKTRCVLWLCEHSENNCRNFSFQILDCSWFLTKLRWNTPFYAEWPNLLDILQECQNVKKLEKNPTERFLFSNSALFLISKKNSRWTTLFVLDDETYSVVDPGFPRRGAQIPEGCANLLFGKILLKKIEPSGGGHL